MLRKKSLTITSPTRRTVSARERKQKSQSSYLQLMNNIAADLGIMLDDLCPGHNEASEKLNILVPTSFQTSNNENHNNARNFFGEPARNKSLNELQAERRRLDEEVGLPFNQMSLTPGPTPVTSPPTQNLSDFGICDPATKMASTLSDTSVYGQPALEVDFTLKERLDLTLDVWYQPEITKNVAVKALQTAPLGSFLFGGSRNKDHLSLTVQQKSDSGYYIGTYPVKQIDDNNVELLKSGQVFKSVTHLVLHHMETKGCLPVLLRLPEQVMAANSLQELQHLNRQATSVWRNSQASQQTIAANQATFLSVPSEPLRTMTRVRSTPQINLQPEIPKFDDKTTSNQITTDLIDLSAKTRTSLTAMPMRRSISCNDSTNPYLYMQQAASAPQVPSFRQPHHSTILDFRNTRDSLFFNPYNPSSEPPQLLNRYNMPSTSQSRIPERDSGLPDYIRESQRFSSSTIHDTISSFDPLADPDRDSGVYPHSRIYRDSACSESSYYQTKSDDTTLPFSSNIASPEIRIESSPQFQTESVIHRKREQFGEQLKSKQPSLDSLDETSRHSGVSSASSGERFSLLSTSSSEESAKNNEESTISTKKGGKTPKYLKNRKESLKKFTKVFGSLSKKKLKQDTRKKRPNTQKINEEVGEQAAEYIENTVLRRSHETGTFLCQTIDAFINSKAEKKHEKPEAMMHSIRQLIGGLKRNLIAMKADPIIREAIQRNTHKLNQDDVESIVESALYQRILVPLKETIYSNYHHEYKKNGSILLLEKKMAAARSQTIEQLGIKANFVPPNEEQMKTIKECFSCLQEAYSPYEKMDLILKAVTYIYDFVGDKEHGRAVQSMGADDFLPMLIYILVQCDMTTIEIETDYIWSLLETSAFTGEPAYYLTTLTSAIHVLKNVEYFDEDEQEGNNEENKDEDNTNDEVSEEEMTEFVIRRSSSVSGTKGFLEVVVTVTTGVFQDKMLPVWPGMSTKQICRNLALKNRIDDKDRENFGLFKLERNTDGQVIKETLLQDNECPQRVKDEMAVKGVYCDLGFKHKFYRVDWPVNEKNTDKTNSDESDEEDTVIDF